MELAVVSGGIHLAAYKPRLSLSGTGGTGSAGGHSDSDCYHSYGDGSNLGSSGSGALTGYETLDSPPNYDFYANTEVWGRQRHFRPSLYQLYAKPEVGIRSLNDCSSFKMTSYLSDFGFSLRMTPDLRCTRRRRVKRGKVQTAPVMMKRNTKNRRLNLHGLVGYKVSW